MRGQNNDNIDLFQKFLMVFPFKCIDFHLLPKLSDIEL